MSITVRKPQQVNKVWGYEDVIVNTHQYCGKKLVLSAGYQSSLHYHPVKNETMYVLSNRMQFESPEGHIQTVYCGDVIDIPAQTPHRFINPFKASCTFVEFSTPHSDSDVIRLEDSRAID